MAIRAGQLVASNPPKIPVSTGVKSVIGLLLALVAPIYLLNLYNHWLAIEPLTPTWVGILALVSILGFYVFVTGQWGIWNAARGADGRASTSKFQAFVWTGAVLWAYVAIVAARGLPSIEAAGTTSGLPSLPPNILVALGISLGTAVGAAAISANATDSGQVVKVPTQDKGLAPIFTSDEGQPDLGKIQLVAFTFIAVAVFLGEVLQGITTDAGTASLPDIDPTLAALMGLGSAVYLGGKLATGSTPFLNGRLPESIKPSDPVANRTVTVAGVNLGSDPSQVQAFVDGELVQTGVTFVAGGVAFVFPPTHADGTAWGVGAVTFHLVVGGRPSNALTVTLVA